MIVFVKVSARRWMTLDCPTVPSGWRKEYVGPAGRALADPRPEAEKPGFMFGTATILAGPADWTTCAQAAQKFAEAEGATWTAAEWEAWQGERAAEIRAANERLQAARKQQKEKR